MHLCASKHTQTSKNVPGYLLSVESMQKLIYLDSPSPVFAYERLGLGKPVEMCSLVFEAPGPTGFKLPALFSFFFPLLLKRKGKMAAGCFYCQLIGGFRGINSSRKVSPSSLQSRQYTRALACQSLPYF